MAGPVSQYVMSHIFILSTTFSSLIFCYCLVFIAENFILSENRTYIISKVGDDAYHGIYGTFSTIAMGSVAYGYFKKVKNAQPMLWNISQSAPLPAKIGSFVCMSIGMGMISQMPPKIQIPVHYASSTDVQQLATSAVATADLSEEQVEKKGWKVRCPFDFTDNKDTNSPVHGLERITRHPGLWSFGLLGLGNALLVPSLPQRLWLSMPLMVALVGGAHTDSRFRRGMGGTLSKEYDEATSNIPFLALLSGRQGNVVNVLQDFAEEVKPLNLALAIGVSGLWVLRKGRGVKVPSSR